MEELDHCLVPQITTAEVGGFADKLKARELDCCLVAQMMAAKPTMAGMVAVLPV